MEVITIDAVLRLTSNLMYVMYVMYVLHLALAVSSAGMSLLRRYELFTT